MQKKDERDERIKALEEALTFYATGQHVGWVNGKITYVEEGHVARLALNPEEGN